MSKLCRTIIDIQTWVGIWLVARELPIYYYVALIFFVVLKDINTYAQARNRWN